MFRSFKFNYLLIVLAIIFNSCTTYNATISKKRELRYGAVEITPTWEYKKPGAKKILPPVAFAGAGAAYGYNTELVIEDETYTGEENALIMAGAGLLTGLVANSILFPKRGKRFHTHQAGKWLAEYNRRTGADYVMVNPPESGRSLVVLPGGLVAELRQNLTRLYGKLNASSQDLTVVELDLWREDLKKAYSVLSTEEIRIATGKLNEHEPRVASFELKRSGEILDRLPNDYRSLSKVNSSRFETRRTYAAATTADQKVFDAISDQKVAAILNAEMKKQTEELASIQLNVSNYALLNSFAGGFYNRYNQYRDHAPVGQLYKMIEEKRTKFLTDYQTELKAKINNAVTIESLDQFSRIYLIDNRQSGYRMRELINMVNNRKVAINDARKAQEKAIAQRIAAEKRRRQQNWRSMTPAQRDRSLTVHDLETAGLSYKSTIKSIYTGDFERIKSAKGTLYLTAFVNNYVAALSSNCINSLAVEKVPYYESVCAEERITTNGWGVQTNRECIRYRQQLAGYTTKTLLMAKQHADNQGVKQSLSILWDYMTSKNPLQQASTDLNAALNGKNDAYALIRKHGCNSPVLRRFEENLKRFVTGEAPVAIQ